MAVSFFGIEIAVKWHVIFCFLFFCFPILSQIAEPERERGKKKRKNQGRCQDGRGLPGVKDLRRKSRDDIIFTPIRLEVYIVEGRV